MQHTEQVKHQVLLVSMILQAAGEERKGASGGSERGRKIKRKFPQTQQQSLYMRRNTFQGEVQNSICED